VKYGARFHHQGTDCSRVVLFANAFDGAPPSAFQVKRADFDALLLDHARDCGVRVHEEARVEEVLFDRGRARGVRVRRAGDATAWEVSAKVVVDATGRDALMSGSLGGRRKDPELNRSAAFAHFTGFRREEGPSGGDIVIVTTPDGWWWLIPFSDGTVSIGVVMPSARFARRPGTVEELFEERIAETPEVRDLVGGNRRLGEVRAIPDYSYRTPRTSGDGFCLVGDAACFLDPVFSSGVLLAMSSGELAAEAIGRALSRRGRVDAADFLEMEKTYGRAISRFSRFVHGFYKPHVLETFYTPSPVPVITGAVTTVLAGGVFRPSLKARLGASAFYLATGLVWLKQHARGRGAFERATGLVERDPAA
jgi:flavin-dependent dehydrogenase